MSKEDAKISCPIFQKQELPTKNLTGRINKAKGIEEKATFAEELLKEADVLLACRDYNEKKLECMKCRTVTKLRMQTANMILKAKKLA